MSAELRRVFVLGLLAVVLGGYAYMTTPEKKIVGAANAKKTERAVFEFVVDKVQKIDAVFEGKHLVCQRTPDGWVKSVDGTSMRQDVMEDFLANLQKLLNLGEVEGGIEQSSEFGLQPPVSRLLLEVEGAGVQVLTIGKNNPVQTSLYAQINDTPQVILIGSVINWDLRKLFTAAGLIG
jgi:uncharacterized protein DUF4340